MLKNVFVKDQSSGLLIPMTSDELTANRGNAQIIKVMYGAEGDGQLVDPTHGLPVAPIGKARTYTYLRVTGAYNSPAGAVRVSVYNNGGSNGTLTGDALPPGTSARASVDYPDWLNAIAMDGTGTELLVEVVQ